jgi:hypothetical protein
MGFIGESFFIADRKAEVVKYSALEQVFTFPVHSPFLNGFYFVLADVVRIQNQKPHY